MMRHSALYRWLKGLLFAAALLGLACTRAQPAPGDLDPSFGSGGKVVTPFGGPGAEDTIGGMALVEKGRFVVAGYTGPDPNYDIALARYLKNGGLDPSFGTGGKVRTDWGGEDFAEGVTALQGGALQVVGGTDAGPDLDFLLARYRSNGSLDPGFAGGILVTDFGADDWAWAVARQQNGRVVVAGETENGDRDLALARYLKNGNLDPSFGMGGKLVTDLDPLQDEQPSAVRVQRDGRILVAGSRHNGLDSDFLVVRYLANGSPDPSFGAGTGWVGIDFGADDFAHDLAVQNNGHIVLGGTSDAAGSNDLALARVNAQGVLDPEFGAGGRVVTPIGGYDAASTVVIQKNRRILVAGRTDDGGNFNFVVVRYVANGDLDSTFGNLGVVQTDFNGEFDGIFDAALWKRRLVAAGVARDGGLDDFALARYLLR